MGLKQRRAKILKCKGFDESLCKACKRLNLKADLLVKSLAENEGRKYCIHYK